MARIGVIIKRQAAIHNLGSIDILCTDKTSTLTEAKIVLERHIDGAGRTSDHVLELAQATSSNFGNMASVAVGSAILTLLPVLPIQILLNNLLYDVSEFAIPFDNSDEEELARPRPWDIGLMRNFLLTVGPVSSLFDLLTFYVMLPLFSANEALFRTG